ncbi:tigger transposable element-derived protein 6-like [Ornithodoros turicata]|uniref:tigger transposable element-derived protein 6-like n=1 Tax=Ornithodoros turicata TaxID=34597 RepID=UPI00313974D7
MDVKKRKNLDFSSKLGIIRRVEHGEKKSSVADAFSIPRSTLSTILKNKAEIKVKASEQNRSGTCRVRAPAYDKVEKALYSWFLDIRSRNIPVDGRMLMEKAKCFAMMFEEQNFCGGSGWLQRFKNRYGIVGKAVSGESECANNGDIEKWLAEEWPEICAAFSPADVFNADETALFWQMLPNKTLDLRGSTCHGGKMSKVRVSILLAANMDGSVKLRPFVIGKSKSPRCLKNCKSLPVRYGFNKKAWMTRDIFVEWLKEWDAQLARSSRKICLLLDNCSAHSTSVKLKNITIKFLPPNTTSKLQPLDQGVIKAFKVAYRRRLVQRLLVNLRVGLELKVDLLGAMQMIAGAWADVKQSTIVNCFGKAGLVAAAENVCAVTEDDDDVSCLDATLRELSVFPGVVAPSVSATDYAGVDDAAEAVAELTDADIVADIAGADEGDSTDDEEPQPLPTATELISAFQVIHRCCVDMEGSGLTNMEHLEKIETRVLNFLAHNKTQAKPSTLPPDKDRAQATQRTEVVTPAPESAIEDCGTLETNTEFSCTTSNEEEPQLTNALKRVQEPITEYASQFLTDKHVTACEAQLNLRKWRNLWNQQVTSGQKSSTSEVDLMH